mmetsp:Transcript_3609/g.8250  ORF Transcript_3609/g.8250 Transcript_3609/m.8250 type:complete len:80 (-) Transcript_3609:2135-2374(-)
MRYKAKLKWKRQIGTKPKEKAKQSIPRQLAAYPQKRNGRRIPKALQMFDLSNYRRCNFETRHTLNSQKSTVITMAQHET